MLLDMQMEDGTPYKRYTNGAFHPGHEEEMQDSARQPLPGQVGHCDYSPEGSDQVCSLVPCRTYFSFLLMGLAPELRAREVSMGSIWARQLLCCFLTEPSAWCLCIM